eukprot:1128216-Pelagomonas_calceolata.AAC.3
MRHAEFYTSYPHHVLAASNCSFAFAPHCAVKVGIFFGAVVRGDLNKIRIGGYSVILDRAVVHAAR